MLCLAKVLSLFVYSAILNKPVIRLCFVQGDFLDKSVKRQRIIAVLFPFLVSAMLFVIAWYVSNFITLPPCFLNKALGIYCPGCGNTRAVIALLHGDILLSLRQNATVAVALVCGILLYIEPLLKAFGKNYRSPLRNYYFLFGIITLLFAYYVARNFIPQIAPVQI